jgi:hypothetical protein
LMKNNKPSKMSRTPSRMKHNQTWRTQRVTEIQNTHQNHRELALKNIERQHSQRRTSLQLRVEARKNKKEKVKEVAKGEVLRGNETEVKKVLIKGSGSGGSGSSSGSSGIGRGDASTATSPRPEAALTKLQVQDEVKHKLLEGKQGVKEPEQQEQPARQKELVLPVQDEVKHKLLEGKQGVEAQEQEQKKTTVLDKVEEFRILLGKAIKKSSRLHKVIFRLKSYNGDAVDGGTIISKIVFQDLVQRIFQKKIVKKHASLTLGKDTKEELWASVCAGKASEDGEKGTTDCAVLQVAKWMNLPGA